MTDWSAKETTTHQDHVIAHVLGATVLGYFELDETAFVLLDIGFIWTMYLDGEMGLLPHPVAINELDTDESAKSQLRLDIDLLLKEREGEQQSKLITAPACECLIRSVEFLTRDHSRRLVLHGDGGTIAIETSLDSGEVRIMNEDRANEESPDGGLADAGKAEEDFVRERLREELGREPTEEELDEWLREHTESY